MNPSKKCEVCNGTGIIKSTLLKYFLAPYNYESDTCVICKGVGAVGMSDQKEADNYSIKPGVEVLSLGEVSMMVNEYEFDPNHNQEDTLHKNVCDLAYSHECLRQNLLDIQEIANR